MNTYDLFVEVVELQSFSAAAKKLHRSPSSISKQISLLEQKLGIQLFNRTTRSLSVTHAGSVYYKHCKDIAQRMTEAELELKDLSDDTKGKLTITWPDVLSDSKVAEVLGRFSKQYPDIKLNIKVSTDILNLTENHIDFAFRVSELDDSSLIAIKLTHIQPLVCAAPEIISSNDQLESMKALLDLPLLIPTYINLAQKLRLHFPDIKNLDKEKYHEVDDIHALCSLAKQGMGATFLFRHMVEKELEEGTLVDLTENLPLPASPIYLVYSQHSYMPKTARYFIDFFKAELLN